MSSGECLLFDICDYLFQLTLLLKLEDMMNRQLTAEIGACDDATVLVAELVQFGFVQEV